tara:strand:+ start:956 stop:1279 length:324 start_codon:yes stop_codon:yes gene_type:complete
MATRFHNITGATSAAAELTRELLAPGDNIRMSSISLCNLHASTGCTVDLYIEKKLTGKFYIMKGVNLPSGTTLIHDFSMNNSTNEFGLYVKLTKGASEVPSVDIVIS